MTRLVLFDTPRRPTAIPWYRAGGAPAPVAAYQPKGSSSLAASYVNLANPGTYNAAPGVPPTWGAVNGWTFNGSTQWLDTGIIPASGYSMIIRFSDVTSAESNNKALAGTWTTGINNRFWIIPRSTGDVVAYSSGASSTVAPALLSGNLCIAGQQGYRNGVADGAAMGAWAGPQTQTCNIGRAAGAVVYLAAKIQALAIYATTLTAQQVAAIYAAMAAL